MAEATKVGRAEEFPEGCGRQVAAGGKAVALFRVGGALHALDGVCPHRGGPLGEGAVADGVVTCPWHGWRFEVATGRCLNVPGKVQPRVAVREEGGDVVVEA